MNLKSIRLACLVTIISAILIFIIYVDVYHISKEDIPTANQYKYAIVKLGNDEIVEGRIESWRDFKNSDQIQVTINGTTYLTHYTNVTLIKK